MPYWVQGNAQQIFHAFGQGWAVGAHKDDSHIIDRDFPATHFLGNLQQATRHFKIWTRDAQGKYYLQGNMNAGNLAFLFGPHPLQKEGEDTEACHANLIRLNFAYINDAGENCGLLVMYRKDDPTQWVMALGKNGHAAPQERLLYCLSSFDLNPFIKAPDSEVKVSPVGSLEPLVEQLGAELPSFLLHSAVNGDNAVTLRFQRIALLMRKLQIKQETVILPDPIPFTELDLRGLFADNPALDLILHYKIHEDLSLSTPLLKDLLTENSRLRQELQQLQLTDDERINKSLIKILLVFHENGFLEQYRKVLTDLELVKKFSAYMWDKTQIKLIPFLLEQKYSIEEIRLVLSEAAYYQALNKLVDLEPALAIEAKDFFNDPKKLEELNLIHSFPDEDCRMLCLIFWVKGSLSEDGYQQIYAATKKYPFMASSLVALDQSKTVDIEKLERHALDPHLHLQDSIRYHFAAELKEFAAGNANLHKLNSEQLNAANQALLLLKQLPDVSPQQYRLVLGKDNKGEALRLLLPQLANIENEGYRKSLVDVLYAGVIGIQTQGNKVLAIKDRKLLALAENLRERFICVTLMQDLKIHKKLVEWVAQENEEAKRFRQIISRVEAQCKVISERLAGSKSYQNMKSAWEKAQVDYRKKVYKIAFDGLMHPNVSIREKLQSVEKNILDIVDPQVEPGIYKFVMDVLIVLTNLIITLCTGFTANAVKYKLTGNLWFFNQTSSGEEIRALHKEVIKLVEPEKTDENDMEQLISCGQMC
ncbi:hypothetical protein OQJ18_12555 [Fluoribacter dumoffii]|uniref:hypothetical protein n=1 Tax=Fluoribacter dumoffii TaxID=463 RepID=UPI0022433886|nr:hypothetical protein [Fluoribacter dumoffii]MCW8387419.1 hypothetical protein [Fluoribacter dumoffii]MCW8417073.1 hypothetical protein [Fluoribacter dumoffii]MCW8455087.1 hypothetical protein [Fluoribacter dumoffii]MCW8460836.1 hypothetical protein [Fluoribacter dumoffii]MCW8484278.1 hypothetical protein [Fluoribacter dumoffii]